MITSAPTASGTVGVTYSSGSPLYTIMAANGPTAGGYTATGLPVGITNNPSNGTFTGIPTAVGTSMVTLGATNSVGAATATLVLTINPPAPVITNTTLSISGTFGTAITPFAIMATHNPTSFALGSGSALPPGLILDPSSGLIMGTPTATGTFSTTITAGNAGGTSAAQTLTFTITGSGSSPILSSSIAGGDYQSLMLKADGTVWASGSDYNGELGNGANADSIPYVPVTAVTGFTNVIAVAAGGLTSLALDSTGHVWAWGRNDWGQLGNGTDGGGSNSADSNVPVKVITSSGGPALSNIIAIAGGEHFSMALDSNGHVWVWGDGGDGELGNGSGYSTHSDFPVEVVTSFGGSALANIVAIAGGATHAMALKSDGTVYTWGDDGDGELGDGMGSSDLPVEVPSFGGITAISAGAFYSLALKNDGTVWAWGYNGDGELGNGTDGGGGSSADSDTPGQVLNLSSVIAISCGGDHALALKSDETVWAWGDNTYYGLGNGTTTGQSDVPVQVPNLTEVIVLGAGNNQNTVLKGDGTIWGWGTQTWDVSLPIQVGDRQTGALPVIAPPAGTITSSQSISITLPPTIPSGTIYYTLDGTEPTTNSLAYTTSFTESHSVLVSAAVFVNGVIASPVASAQYYINDSGSTGLPTSVASVTNTVSGNAIDLSWGYSSGPTNYNTVDVYRSTDGTNYYLLTTLNPSATSYVDSTALGGTNYWYEIGTVNSSGSTNTATASSTNTALSTTLNIYVTTPSGATNLP